jgi:cytochrome c553
MEFVLVGVVCFVLGGVIQRTFDLRKVTAPPMATAAQPAPAMPTPLEMFAEAANFDRSGVDFSKQPLWAWGKSEPPKPGEKAGPQAAPTGRKLRANEDPEVQQRMRRVEGSKAEFSLVDIRDAVNVVDWFPEDHPNPMPDIIKHGPASLTDQKRGCGSCHLGNGQGRPENASPAGLPPAYLLRQLHDFKNGLRHNADPRKANSNTMVMLARSMSDAEMKEAADYFAAAKWTANVKVIETNLVPKTRIQGELFIAASKERTEPIAGRIIEVPADDEQTELLRNPHATWIAYVPAGAIKRGRDLVTLGGMTVVNGQIVQGKTTACGTCHGENLMGVLPDIPALAGRSPSYIARELFDIQQGTRTGSNTNVQLMRMAIAKLTPEDIVDIAAYLASRPAIGGPSQPTSEQVASR